ncbi:hypothetical protein KUCAC02_002333 [Chaenocephalus aceratus]|uniref:Uncharacterized protein n=1 Tax=Chaenocephalus aceratus TaxID=36190 RepID=A0ACB9XUG0_CHAAC|nr:hypothetical protein KUCAC02_002333 [Chaenocephalus aceratus]
MAVDAWIHFVRKDNGSVECNTYSKLISCKGGTTTNRTKHLRLHGIQTKECTVCASLHLPHNHRRLLLSSRLNQHQALPQWSPHNQVAQCTVCQAGAIVIKQEVEYTPIKVTQPFELIRMDLIGKLAITKNEYHTKKNPHRSRQRICQCHKYPDQWIGGEDEWCNTESTQQIGRKRPETWEEHLDAVMFGLRTKKQMTTKCSPYFLMFGREARHPSEVPDHYMVDGSVEDVVGQESLTEEILHLEDTLKEARENVTRAHEKTRQRLKSASGDRF